MLFKPINLVEIFETILESVIYMFELFMEKLTFELFILILLLFYLLKIRNK